MAKKKKLKIATKAQKTAEARIQKNKFNPKSLEQSILRFLKAHSIQGGTLYVAFSGGLDSTVLLFVLSLWARHLNIKLKAIHIYHGHSRQRTQNQKWALKICNELQIEILTNHEEPIKKLKSENDLREFRIQKIKKLISGDQNSKNQNFKNKMFLATAHHQDDQVETLLLRLLRGVGPQGFSGIAPVAQSDASKICPLLGHSREEIAAYAKSKKLKWFEDQSNKSTDPMRNWVRHVWLNELDKRESGLKASLARSLLNLQKAFAAKEAVLNRFGQKNASSAYLAGDKIILQKFLTLGRADQESLLASYMARQNLKNYSKNHISEVLKRLDTSRRELSFRLLSTQWTINAQHIFCEAL